MLQIIQLNAYVSDKPHKKYLKKTFFYFLLGKFYVSREVRKKQWRASLTLFPTIAELFSVIVTAIIEISKNLFELRGEI